MSAWDREEAVKRYTWRLRRSSDPAALMRHFGTPTKVAVELARGYVSSPPPPGFLEGREQQAERDFLPEEAWEDEAERPPEGSRLRRYLEAAQSSEKTDSAGSGKALFLVFAIVIGVPVALALLCVGLPFVAAGIGIIMAAAAAVAAQIGALPLLSDVLLLSGAGLMILAVGVVVVWFGVWLGFSLCRLWLGRVVGRLGGRFYGD